MPRAGRSTPPPPAPSRTTACAAPALRPILVGDGRDDDVPGLSLDEVDVAPLAGGLGRKRKAAEMEEEGEEEEGEEEEEEKKEKKVGEGDGEGDGDGEEGQQGWEREEAGEGVEEGGREVETKAVV
ncbi:hypothetical protein UCRNP2_666 [Neofusicoccum parvum UCRNP2]|uniref:Uncharacterized protein n=1 Tax=Botryosphaeria parva (strain UCR-NP2) TaxID=1287680 RepID=R1GW06_BOTPV|nr:hypothetical protein UCRNP2_666 [Neofusicoccum parvum UCRNP2]